MKENIISDQVMDSIKNQVKGELNVSDVNNKDNLIEKGLSSIMIMKISNALRKFGIRVSFAKLMENPTIEKWEDLVMNAAVRIRKNKDIFTIKDNADEEFPLTDVQYAYWIGREDDQVLGGVGCHAYLEIDGENIDVHKLKESWNILQNTNPMLRVKFNKNGTQQIMKAPFSEEIGIYDFRLFKQDDIDTELVNMRNKLSHRKLQVEDGQVAGLNIVLLPDNKYRIFLDVDLLIADVMSLSILIDELSKIYNREIETSAPEYTFKDYIRDNYIDKKTIKEDEIFWKNKILSFPKESPNLPLKKKPELIGQTLFSRRKKVIDNFLWTNIKRKFAKYKVTPAMVLLACYSLIIERWTNQDKFAINMPLFNRDTENGNAKNMIADFTNLLLVECVRKENETVLGRIKRLGDVFLENVSHSSYSGVQVQRDIYKEVGKNNNVAPIIFACNIDYPLETEKSKEILGKITYMLSQTPQVWLDFQTYIVDGNLVMCWDAVDELYPEGMIDDMFTALQELLEFLVDNNNWDILYDVLPKKQRVIRERELKDILPLKYTNKTLYTDFINMAKLNPNYVAIIDAETGDKITYKELCDKSLKLAAQLIQNGVKKGDYVGITLPRGYVQIIGLLGILFAGAVYVPIGINQPKERRKKICEQIGIEYVISDKDTINRVSINSENVIYVSMDDIGDKIALNSPVEIKSSDSAYVIMTSGTTGVPKGVEICHDSAINTIIDINEKYNIVNRDTIIMVSAIDFDLSVYDIFGLLSVGGTIITLNEDNFKNPDLWIELIEKYNVTLWNSVPILFDMLITMAEGKDVSLPLRTVLLSGDWIATNLPRRFYDRSKNSVVVAMGGATEASIWSNYINVPKEIPKDWISIPYGKALKNQVYRVVDDFGRTCPNYVRGELLIGGIGVAKCYRGDEELTRKKFIYKDGIRWYKTGDTGRTWNDGTIEFLGRKDNQVKIKGHRIELGEIEDAITKYPDIKNVVVDVTRVGVNEQLTAFLEHNEYMYETVSEFEEKLKERIVNTSIKYNDFSIYLRKLNNSIITFIFDLFKSWDIFNDHRKYTFSEIMEKGEFKNDYEQLILRWLSILTKYNILNVKDGKYSLNRKDELTVQLFSENEKETHVLKTLKPEIIQVLQGKKNAIEVFYNEELKLSPTNFLRGLKNYNENIQRIAEIIKEISNSQSDKFKILEIGGRDAKFTNAILEIMKGSIDEYVYCDSSKFFEYDFERIESEYKYFEYRKVNLENDSSYIFKANEFDLVILYNSLHRFKDISEEMVKIKHIVNDGGFIVGTEINDRNLLSEISASVLEKGFNNYDLEKVSNNIIPNIQTIRDIFKNNYLKEIYTSECEEIENTGNMLFVARKENILFSPHKLKEFLKERLPEYMIPISFVQVQRMPLNQNGKVDRKKLKEITNKGSKDKEAVLIENTIIEQNDEITIALIDIWKEILDEKNLGINSNYFHVGGDSLLATRLVSKIKEDFGIELSIGDVFEHPILSDLSVYIQKKEKGKEKSETIKIIETNPKNENDPFDLTDVQFAYWVGRSGAYSLGRVSTHCYFELDCFDIDMGKLQRVINHMIKEHGMLRAIILNNGKQQILKYTPSYILNINDISSFDEDIQKEILLNIRKEMSHEVLKTNQWPLFNFRGTFISKNKLRFHVSFDNLILDGWSMFHILEEIKRRYDDESFTLFNIDVSFRDYVLAFSKMKKSLKYEKDKTYWLNRLDGFLEAPKFKAIKSEFEIENQSFNRREKYIESNEWASLKQLARKNNITPTILLITMFSEVLRKYSINKEFVLNITQFNREQVHPKINEIVGDFTTLTLLEVRISKENTILKRAEILQKQLAEDINHSLYSAIEFGRELRLKTNNEKRSLMPIVFTSGLGINQNTAKGWLGKLVYNISQTPQVWLDHQVLEEDEKLKLIWDSVDEIFPHGLLDNMFNDYIESIENLARNQDVIFEEIEIKDSNKYLYDLHNKDKNTSKSINKKTKECDIKNLVKICETKEFRVLLNEISGIWEELLGVKSIEKDDNFFSLGGNSLNMIQLSNLLIERYNYQMDMTEFMENSNIEYVVESLMNHEANTRS